MKTMDWMLLTMQQWMDLFRKNVDHQQTLHSVPLPDLTQNSHINVAEGDPGEVTRIAPNFFDQKLPMNGSIPEIPLSWSRSRSTPIP